MSYSDNRIPQRSLLSKIIRSVVCRLLGHGAIHGHPSWSPGSGWCTRCDELVLG